MLCIKMRWVPSTCGQFIFFSSARVPSGFLCEPDSSDERFCHPISALRAHENKQAGCLLQHAKSPRRQKDQSRYKANRIDPMPSFPPQAPMHQSLTESLVGEARCGGCSNIKASTAFTPILMRSHWEPHQQSRSIMLRASNEHLRMVWRGCASKEWHWRRYPKIRTPWSGPEQSQGKNHNVKTPTGCGPHP